MTHDSWEETDIKDISALARVGYIADSAMYHKLHQEPVSQKKKFPLLKSFKTIRNVYKND